MEPRNLSLAAALLGLLAAPAFDRLRWRRRDRAVAGGESKTSATDGKEPADDVDLTELPLGDGYISTEPAVDNVYSCQVDFPDNAGGSLVDGPWIDEGDSTWNAEEKVAVPGEVLEPSEFDVAVKGDTRRITGNDLPDEPVGEFPVGEKTEAYQYDPNPSTIDAQDFALSLPALPEEADSPECLSLGAIGVLVDGGYLFNALDGPGRDAVAHEIQDECDEDLGMVSAAGSGEDGSGQQGFATQPPEGG